MTPYILHLNSGVLAKILIWGTKRLQLVTAIREKLRSDLIILTAPW